LVFIEVSMQGQIICPKCKSKTGGPNGSLTRSAREIKAAAEQYARFGLDTKSKYSSTRKNRATFESRRSECFSIGSTASRRNLAVISGAIGSYDWSTGLGSAQEQFSY
jgi:hypothetical protein